MSEKKEMETKELELSSLSETSRLKTETTTAQEEHNIDNDKVMDSSNTDAASVFKVPTLNILPMKKSSNKVELENPEKKVESSKDGQSLNDSIISGSTKDTKKSPAEILNEKNIPLPYKEPSWSSVCDEEYKFEVLKNGTISEVISLKDKAYVVFGRLTNCDNVMHHPSISRYHAVVQYRDDSTSENIDGETSSGCFLYDLGSTHGTFLNKQQLKPKVYYRVRVGHMIKFGNSTRLYILQGPSEDQEEESEETVSELMEKAKKQREFMNRLENGEEEDDNMNEKAPNPTVNKSDEDNGISWGMGDDAEEEPDLSVNPFSLCTPNEELYLDDPKKTLRGYFEREGCELEYKVEEKGYSQFICQVELPIDTPTGQPVIAEASVKGKKKEAVIQCALEACRILDRQGLLRQAKHESKKRKQKNWEADDYYDSDEDTFLDRTGSIEKKREKRMAKANKIPTKTETYESLNEKMVELNSKIEEIEAKLAKSIESEKGESGEDSLDAFMSSMNDGVIMDKKSMIAMKIKLSQLKQEKIKLEKLIDLAKPADLPSLKKLDEAIKTEVKNKRQLPLTGSMRGTKKRFKYLSAPKVLPSFDKPTVNPALTNNEQSEKSTNNSSVEIENESDGKPSQESDASADAEIVERLKLSEENDGKQDKGNEETVKVPDEEAPTIDKNGTEVSTDIEKQLEAIEKKEMKRKQKALKKKEKMTYEYDSSNPDYAMWIPPENQKGDGRTHLNERYGY